MADDALKKHAGDRHEGPVSTSPYPMSRLAPPHALVDVAREIERADQMLGAVVGNKLELIEAAERDAKLHRARCNFQRRPGAVYHLYESAAGAPYFSMLSPEEWGGSPPDRFVGSYRLELDMSWTEIARAGGDVVEARSSEPR
jgi:hypothetical protein